MERRKKPKKILLFAGLILITLSVAAAMLLASLRYEELWHWYVVVSERLLEIEEYIASLDKVWQFIGAILLLFAVKSFFPIYATSTVCFLTGVVLPMYLAIPVNILGFTLLITVRYFWGKRFGAGNAWRMISKWDIIKKLIQQDGTGNPTLLIMLRLIPGMPINTFSNIYGSFDFGYWKFVLLSIIGFMPRLLSFTLVGRNVFDPLSPGFLVPLMIICFLSGVSCFSVNGVWIGVEKIVEYAREREKKKQNKAKNKATEKGKEA